MSTRIIGVSLVRDEDVFVERALRNLFGFCDELILIDHRSRDRTPEILERVAAESPVPASLHRVRDARRARDLISGYAGEAVWILGVDGDEIYDPVGLGRFRQRLLSGELDGWWFVKGIQLHCRRLDLETETAEGWQAPPARSTTKLFNLAAVSSWAGPAKEPFYGGRLVLRPGYENDAYWLRDERPWDESDLRCLHLPFFRRSSRQGGTLRMSIAERAAGGRRARALRHVRALARRPEPPPWKLTRYTQGELVTLSIKGFFAPTDAARLGDVVDALPGLDRVAGSRAH